MDTFSILNILVPIWIIASFVGSARRWFQRESSWTAFLIFIGEFLFYPVVRALEEFGVYPIAK